MYALVRLQPDRIGRYDLYGRRYRLDVTFRV